MVKFNDIRRGSVVIVRSNFGTGNAIQVTVSEVEQAAKNGKDVFDYAYGGNMHWAYFSQIDSVLSY